MNDRAEAEVNLISTAVRYWRLRAAFDRGEPVKVSLEQAYWAWARAKGAVADAERAQVAS